METKQLTCICCPMGCALQVEMEDGRVSKVTGNQCRRGAVYGKKEVVNPMRMVTTTVHLKGGGVLPVKTGQDVPKGKVMEIVRELKSLEIEGPVRVGETIRENVAGTGVSVMATACS